MQLNAANERTATKIPTLRRKVDKTAEEEEVGLVEEKKEEAKEEPKKEEKKLKSSLRSKRINLKKSAVSAAVTMTL